MDLINSLLGNVSDFMYTYILIIMLILVGLYFSFRTKFVQFRMFPEAIRVLGEKKKDGKDISSFQALMISTASRVGTGNIAGVATAVAASTAIGGYGAIFWMWLLALIGAASAFIESTLAQMYKQKEGTEFIGGPAYYIQKALESRKWGIVFSILLIACFAYGFNALQSFNAGSSLAHYIPNYNETIWPLVVGGVLALLTAAVIFGGVHRISSIVSGIVPVMAVIYIGLGLFITIKNINAVPEMFGKIFTQAFNIKAIFGGFTGSCVMQGIKRGLYSNEAGMGSAPNAAAAADVSHPVKQGLVQMLSVFIDTLLLCTATAMMCMSSGIDPAKELQGAPWVQASLQESLGSFGPIFITVAMVFFAFTTLLGNCFYCDNLLIYIHKKQPEKAFMKGFRLVSALVIFLGAGMEMSLLWDLSDVLMGVMALINIPVILILSGIAFKAIQDYEAQLKQGINPVFKSADIGLRQKTDFWS